MPTGYTADIEKGISFRQFAMRCAHNFGACISIRDESWDKEIPEKFESDTYHKKEEINKKEAQLDRLLAMPDDECEERAREQYYSELGYLKESIEKDKKLAQKYRLMLHSIEEWNPPTSDHKGLKKFMREQVEESLKFDCGTDYFEECLTKLKRKTGKEWKEQQRAKLQDDIAYHKNEDLKERERAQKATEWIQALRKSLS